jgi:ABC-2 type transport system permease protein
MSQLTALRVGVARGLIELRHAFTGAELIGQIFWPALMLVTLFFMRNRAYESGVFSLGALALPGILGMYISFATLLMTQYLSGEREDGTLLRAKATPNGIRGYFMGKLVTASGGIVAQLLIILLPGLLIVDGVKLDTPQSWLTLAWVLLLGLVATLSIGAMLGSMVSSFRAASYLGLPVMALAGISGIFYPITALPLWLQWAAQAFPMYWLGLGMRSALLPDSAAAIEIGGSWRHVETATVLGIWAVVGLAFAPMLMRRMARRESGSGVARRREQHLQRIA